MQERVYWSPWAQFLQHLGVHEPVAALLEAGGALNLLLAQLVYLGQPLVGRESSTGQWEALAHMLENPEETRSFASYLRQDNPLPDGTSPLGEGTSPLGEGTSPLGEGTSLQGMGGSGPRGKEE